MTTTPHLPPHRIHTFMNSPRPHNAPQIHSVTTRVSTFSANTQHTQYTQHTPLRTLHDCTPTSLHYTCLSPTHNTHPITESPRLRPNFPPLHVFITNTHPITESPCLRPTSLRHTCLSPTPNTHPIAESPRLRLTSLHYTCLSPTHTPLRSLRDYAPVSLRHT